MLALIGAMAGIGFILVPPAVAQVKQLVAEGPALLQKAQDSEVWHFLQRHGIATGHMQRPSETLQKVADPLLAIVTSIFGLVAAVVTVLFVVVFMLASGRQLIWSALAKSRPKRRGTYARTLRAMYTALGGYVGGLFAIVLINATLSGTFLAIIGVPYFLPLAVLSGLSSLVPYVGAIVAGVLMTIVAWASNGATAGIGTAVYYVVYQQVENHLIAPLVYRKTVHLNPLVILLTVLFFTELAGIPGSLVAVPTATVAQIVLGEILRARRERLGLPKTEPDPSLLEAH
jgi:predicted PurR-regulated permease PerM